MAISVENLHFRPSVPVFDAQICVGSGRSAIGPAADRNALLQELDRSGTGRALVYHIYTEEFSPVQGNEMLESWLIGDDRLVPLWAVLPIPDSLAQIQQLHQTGRVRAVRLTSGAGIPFSDWTHGELLSWLAAVGIPLWVPVPEFDAQQLVATLRQFPELQVVFVGAHYSHTLLMKKALAALPNAFVELSRLESLNVIGDLVEEFGANRLIYGSWYPRYAIGPMLYFLHHSYLPPTALTQICAENLLQLLKLPEVR